MFEMPDIYNRDNMSDYGSDSDVSELFDGPLEQEKQQQMVAYKQGRKRKDAC